MFSSSKIYIIAHMMFQKSIMLLW